MRRTCASSDSAVVPATVETTGSALLPSAIFSPLVATLPSGAVSLEVRTVEKNMETDADAEKDTVPGKAKTMAHTAVVSVENSVSRVRLLDMENYPDAFTLSDADINIKVAAQDLRRAIDETQRAA